MTGHSKSKPSVVLLERLRPLLVERGIEVPEGAALVSMHHGYLQRMGGAWSWQMEPFLGPTGTTLGSQFSMGKLLIAVRLEINRSASGDWHVDPTFAGGCS